MVKKKSVFSRGSEGKKKEWLLGGVGGSLGAGSLVCMCVQWWIL